MMHTVQLLQQALQVADRMGYGVRHEWLGGGTGGGCEIAGKKWLFVDLALGPAEQLDQVIEALRCDPLILAAELPIELRQYMGIRQAA